MASKVLYLHDRRQLSDRRRDFIFYSWRQLFGGRRKHLRRSTDHKKLHIDYYEPKLLLIVSTIFVLSFTDAWFTLTLLKRGSTELNPLMNLLISHGIRHFVGYKMALTGLSLVLLVMGHNIRIFGNFRIYHLLWLFLGVYGLLIGYELVLLLQAIWESAMEMMAEQPEMQHESLLEEGIKRKTFKAWYKQHPKKLTRQMN